MGGSEGGRGSSRLRMGVIGIIRGSGREMVSRRWEIEALLELASFSASLCKGSFLLRAARVSSPSQKSSKNWFSYYVFINLKQCFFPLFSLVLRFPSDSKVSLAGKA